jgi:betaine-aldehyde dehydrogenase
MPAGVETEVKTYQMFINGEWVASKTSKTFPVYDPSTEEVIAQVPNADANDVNRAVAAAKAAFEEGPWATSTAQERGRVLFRLAEKIRQNVADAGRTRVPQHRQADRRSRVRYQ